MMSVRTFVKAVCLVSAGTWAAAQGAKPDAATYAGRDTINSCLKQIPVVSATGYRVSCQVRTGKNDVEVHAKETDIFVIMEGSATFVTGGTLVDADNSNALQIKAKGINGGDTRELVKGDVIVIPAGVPHWFKNIPTSIGFLSTKVFNP
jgi:mannose-6-phosphate isomerase-like protein (cupin superfamily)